MADHKILIGDLQNGMVVHHQGQWAESDRVTDPQGRRLALTSEIAAGGGYGISGAVDTYTELPDPATLPANTLYIVRQDTGAPGGNGLYRVEGDPAAWVFLDSLNLQKADEVPFDNAASGLAGTTVQAAIDEIVGAAGSRLLHVDGSRSDTYVEDGTALFPFKTVRAALTAIGNAADVTEFNDPGKQRYVLNVAPGLYDESAILLSVPLRPTILFQMDQALIVGDLAQDWSADPTLRSGATRATQVIMRGSNLRPAYVNGAHVLTGIDGSITLTSDGTGDFPSWQLLNIGITGTFNTAGGQQHLLVENSALGGIAAAVEAPLTLYAERCDTSSSMNLGDVSGPVYLYSLRDVRFKAVTSTSSLSGNSWRNVRFGTGTDLSGMTGSVKMDACSFSQNRDFLAAYAGTIELEDVAEGTGYTDGSDDGGGNSAWDGTAPANVAEALNRIAGKLAQHLGSAV
jgi:hypothetical protein